MTIFTSLINLSGYVTWELNKEKDFFIISALISMVFGEISFSADAECAQFFWSRPRLNVVVGCFWAHK
jgi:hypothetical protein